MLLSAYLIPYSLHAGLMAYSHKRCVKPLVPTADQLVAARAFSDAAYLAVTERNRNKISSMHLPLSTLGVKVPFHHKPPSAIGLSAVAWHRARQETSQQMLVNSNTQTAKVPAAEASTASQAPANMTANSIEQHTSAPVLPVEPDNMVLPTADVHISVIPDSSGAKSGRSGGNANASKTGCLRAAINFRTVQQPISTSIQHISIDSSAMNDQSATAVDNAPSSLKKTRKIARMPKKWKGLGRRIRKRFSLAKPAQG